MEEKNGRIKYLDVAKGLLIVCVILGHVPSHIKLGGVSTISSYMDLIKSYDYWYIPFFMPGFFIITGFCSNHAKPFKEHLVSNLKTTLVPAFFIYLFTLVINSLVNRHLFLPSIHFFVDYNALLWFFPALFLSKEIYWILNRYILKRLLLFGILTVFCFLGVCLGKSGIIPNLFYFKQSLIFCIFIMIGHELKIRGLLANKNLFFCCYIYPIMIIILKFFSIDIPGIGFNFRMSVIQVPLYIVLAVIGSLFVIKVAELLDGSKILAFFGIWSGFFYGFHFCAMDNSIMQLKKCVQPLSLTDSLAFCCMIAVITLAICSLFVFLLNHKYFRIFLGKI